MRNLLMLPAFLLAAVIGLTACNPNNNNNPTPSTGYSGILFTSLSRMDTNISNTYEDAGAVFFTQPGGTSPTFVDSVRINSYTLSLDPADSFAYGDNGNIPFNVVNFNGPSTWQVWGANGVPSFTYTHSSPYPVYNGGHLPDTVYKSQGLNLPLNVTGADSVYVTVGTDSLGNPYTKSFAPNAATATFTPVELAHVFSSPFSVIEIRAGKSSTQTFGGKNYLFQKGLYVGGYTVIM